MKTLHGFNNGQGLTNNIGTNSVITIKLYPKTYYYITEHTYKRVNIYKTVVANNNGVEMIQDFLLENITGKGTKQNITYIRLGGMCGMHPPSTCTHVGPLRMIRMHCGSIWKVQS